MRLVITAAALFMVGMGVFEVVMQPSAEDRISAAVVVALMAVGTAAAAFLLPTWARRTASLRHTIVVLGSVSLLVLAVALVVAGREMFLSDHDVRLLLVLVGFGVVATLVFSVSVSGPLTEDLTRIATTSTAIAEGDLSARTEVHRSDEAGRLARDVDVMASALESAENARRRDEESRRALFAAVSHDLRTPLASMRVAIEALQDGLVDRPSRYFDSLEADIDALSQLVEDLFLLARLESGDVSIRKEALDLTEIADEAIEVLRPIAVAKDVEVSLEADHRVLGLGDVGAVARVVRNLLDNAIRHSPRGSHVIILAEKDPRVRLTIIDEGSGFPHRFVEQAFERFTRGDDSRLRSGGGAGLGLAIAKAYVAAMNGEIQAEPGPGGRIWFWLPDAKDDPAAEPVAEMTQPTR